MFEIFFIIEMVLLQNIYNLFLFLTATFIGLLGLAVFRALILIDPNPTQYCTPDEPYYFHNKLEASNRLSDALKFKTVSYTFHTYEREALMEFLSFLKYSFPLVHSSPIISKEVVNELSLLYYVQGSNKNLKPYLLAGHMDVVPVEESKWVVDPFKGEIKDGFIWGRGSMDCKHLVMGILESLEFLLSKEYTPQRSFYLAFGHDEEVNGLDGAREISLLLESRNVELEYVLDEGSFIIENFIPGIKAPLAFVSISEKGLLNLELSVNATPGHSSMPGKENAIVILAKALSKLEGDVFPSMFGKGPEKEMFQGMGFAATFPLKVILANSWLFKPLLIRYMTTPVMSAFHKTTIAVTVVNGGTKTNVLPSYASAHLNLRIHPAQSVEEVINFLKKIIHDDRVKLAVKSSFAPHPISPTDSFGYLTIKNTINQISNESYVVPCTLIANTDTKWYLNLTDSIYRFNFVHVEMEDIKRVHGHNERISVDNYSKLINFFVHLIRNSDSTVIGQHIHAEL